MTGPLPIDGWLPVDGFALHYLDWGNASAPGMLLLHGTASHARVWDHFAQAFRDRYHVVALDQRGHGDSEAPPDHETGYLPGAWLSDVAAVVEHLELAPVVLIGLSAGGNTAMHFTANHPEIVSRLVIIEMGPQAARAGVARVYDSIPAREEFESGQDAIDYLTRSAGRADPVLAREHARHAVKQLDDGRVILKGDAWLRDRSWRRPLRTAEENWAAARAVSRPALLIRGGESKLLAPETADQMVREMPDCTLVTIAGAGHSVPLHRPLELEAAVRDWLDGRAD